MGQPAARLTDMHVCPMVTPAPVPVPHVGGPITGPGIPNVLIGKMPAAVMGDMCVCVGPPDVIMKGSTGVMIGKRPAARMGDITAHGGTIVFGFPMVLIGEVGASAPPVITITPVMVMVQPVVIPPIVFNHMPPESGDNVNSITDMQNAASNGSPTVDACDSGGDTGGGESPAMPEEEEEETIESKILDNYFTDKEGNRIEAVSPGDEVVFVIESQELVGEEVSLNLDGEGVNYEYQGAVLEDDILTLTIGSDAEKLDFKVVAEEEEVVPPKEIDNPKGPKVKGSSFVDDKGQELEGVLPGQTVYLLVETQSMTGEEITIEFDGSGSDYEYDGKNLENESIVVNIEKDGQMIPLKVVESNQG